MDSMKPVVFLEVHHFTKYSLDVKTLGLKMNPHGNKKEKLDIVCSSGSNYAGDPVTRSEIGFILHASGVSVSW